MIRNDQDKKTDYIALHLLAIMVGLPMMLLGIGLSVTMVLLPIGVPIALLSLAALVWGLTPSSSR
jgi:hypothetical protein